uniref:Uncharacterized protein n=1 Tax=Panagrellus redivivus TaxID=6233 RepID=A0A7E4USA2_PANRE
MAERKSTAHVLSPTFQRDPSFEKKVRSQIQTEQRKAVCHSPCLNNLLSRHIFIYIILAGGKGSILKRHIRRGKKKDTLSQPDGSLRSSPIVYVPFVGKAEAIIQFRRQQFETTLCIAISPY